MQLSCPICLCTPYVLVLVRSEFENIAEISPLVHCNGVAKFLHNGEADQENVALAQGVKFVGEVLASTIAVFNAQQLASFSVCSVVESYPMMTYLLVLMILNFRHLQLVLKTTSGVKFTCAALRTFPHQHAVETNQETIYIYQEPKARCNELGSVQALPDTKPISAKGSALVSSASDFLMPAAKFSAKPEASILTHWRMCHGKPSIAGT